MKTQSVRRRSPHRGNRRTPVRKFPPKQRRTRSPEPRGRKASSSFGRLTDSGKPKDRRDYVRSPAHRRTSRSPLRRGHSPVGRAQSALWRSLSPQRRHDQTQRSLTPGGQNPSPRQGLYPPKGKSPRRDRLPAARKRSRSRSPNRSGRSNAAKHSYSGTPHTVPEPLTQSFTGQPGQSYTLSPGGDIGDRQRAMSAFSNRFGGSDPDYDEKPVFHGPEGGAFDRNELKKITVDIRRNIPRSGSPVVRKIQNPEDVVIVRRQGEGVRPLFERDDVKAGTADRIREPQAEPRVVALIRDPSPLPMTGSRYEASPPRYKDYKEPTRGAVDSYYPPSDPMYPPPREQGGNRPPEFGNQSPHSQSLSREPLRERDRGYMGTDRPPYYDRNKDHFRIDREEERRKDDFHREMDWRKPEDDHQPEPDLRHELAWRKVEDIQYPDSYLGNQADPVRDFQRPPIDDRHQDPRRPDGRGYDSRRAEDLRRELDWRKGDTSSFPADQKSEERSSDLRHRINEKRTDRIDDRQVREQLPSVRRDEVDMRERLNERRGLRLAGGGSSTDRKRDADREKRRGSPLDSKSRFKSPREQDRGRGPFKGDDHLPQKELLPDFSQRPDKYQYKAWEDNPEFVPRGRDYFEHDNRETGTSLIRPVAARGRGFSRGWGLGFGGRGRGFSRGFRGGRFSSTFRGRGRGVPPRE